MNISLLTDILTATGLILTAGGAAITARAVILQPKDAISIGVARYGFETDEENLALPAVRNLLRSSRAALFGLGLIVSGTMLQLVPYGAKLTIWLSAVEI